MFLKRSLIHLLLYMFLALIARKLMKSHMAMSFVREYRETVEIETFRKSSDFVKLVVELKKMNFAPAFLMLNQHALNITLNWLCNIADMPNMLERVVIITLDEPAYTGVSERWPGLKILYWPVPCLLNRKFGYGEGAYQLFELFRSNFAIALLESGVHFWMIQADTFWREDLFSAGLERVAKEKKYDIFFDRAGDDGLQAQLIAGGYFYARASPRSIQFFQNLSWFLGWWYTPDNTIMSRECAYPASVSCGFIPYGLITRWQWFNEDRQWSTAQVPYLFQLDCEDGGSEEKLNKMRRTGLYFLSDTQQNATNFQTCNATAVHRARNMEFEKLLKTEKSWKELQLSVYVHIADIIYCIPYASELLKRYLVLMAYFFMLTM